MGYKGDDCSECDTDNRFTKSNDQCVCNAMQFVKPNAELFPNGYNPAGDASKYCTGLVIDEMKFYKDSAGNEYKIPLCPNGKYPYYDDILEIYKCGVL